MRHLVALARPVLVDADGRIVYLAVDHDMGALDAAIREVLAQ